MPVGAVVLAGAMKPTGVCSDPAKEIGRRERIRIANSGSNNSQYGKHHTEEHKKKIGDALRGIPLSEETKRKLSESRMGMKFSPEHIENMRRSRLGKKHTPDHCRHISDGNTGKKMSEEAKQKIRESKIGDKNPMFGKTWTKTMYEKCIRRLEEHPRWKGGISFEPYCPKFNNEFKERVRAFFGYYCVECGSSQLKQKHGVHHVNFDKMTCCNDAIPLFVPLCRSCHGKIQTNRPYWEQHFTDMINNRYGGKCYFTSEEMKHYVRS